MTKETTIIEEKPKEERPNEEVVDQILLENPFFFT